MAKKLMSPIVVIEKDGKQVVELSHEVEQAVRRYVLKLLLPTGLLLAVGGYLVRDIFESQKEASAAAAASKVITSFVQQMSETSRLAGAALADAEAISGVVKKHEKQVEKAVKKIQVAEKEIAEKLLTLDSETKLRQLEEMENELLASRKRADDLIESVQNALETSGKNVAEFLASNSEAWNELKGTMLTTLDEDLKVILEKLEYLSPTENGGLSVAGILITKDGNIEVNGDVKVSGRLTAKSAAVESAEFKKSFGHAGGSGVWFSKQRVELGTDEVTMSFGHGGGNGNDKEKRWVRPTAYWVVRQDDVTHAKSFVRATSLRAVLSQAVGLIGYLENAVLYGLEVTTAYRTGHNEKKTNYLRGVNKLGVD